MSRIRVQGNYLTAETEEEGQVDRLVGGLIARRFFTGGE